jgi:hypothetical protein
VEQTHGRFPNTATGFVQGEALALDGLVKPVDEGMPQGGPLSPLLSNIMLDDFDRELERRGLRFARYADDRGSKVSGIQLYERVRAEAADIAEGCEPIQREDAGTDGEGLGQWFRRRLRSAIWKQWKRGKVRFAELRKRGVGKDLAAQTAGSSHGPWRLADSPGLHIALPNAYFDSLGIPRLTVS